MTKTKADYQIMPLMTEDQYQELKDDIKRNGVLEPIEYDQDNNIIDGHHRMRVIMELHLEGHDVDVPPAITRNYATEEDKLRNIIALNVKRRHLSAEQRQQLAFTLRKRGMTMQKVADMLNIGVSTVHGYLSALSEADQAELKKVVTVSEVNGKTYLSTSIMKAVYATGQSQMRDLKQREIIKAAESIKLLGPPQTVATIPEQEVLYLHVVTKDPAPIPAEDAHKRLSAFAWYGGKSSHLSWLLPLLPPAKSFVDVFGGSAAVLMNREPSPIETYNDLDSDVVNFFRVLREQPERLAQLLALTPYSREERRTAFEAIRTQSCTDDLERARQFFVLARQTRGESQRRDNSVLNSWKFTRDRVQAGMSNYISTWDSGIDGLAAVAARLRRVQIENYPWQKIIELYDTPEALLYCDPPYPHETREYTHQHSYTTELTTDDHRKLAAALHACKGLVALSSYPSALYDELYADWHRVDMPVTSFASAGAQNARIECLFTNYPTLKQEIPPA